MKTSRATQLFLPTFAILAFLFTACAPKGAGSAAMQVSGDSAELFQTKSIGKQELQKMYNVALTFDDGPHPGVTEPLLDLLKREHIHATFFILGEHVRGNEAILARMKAEGHVVANHSFSHSNMASEAFVADPDKVVREILQTDRLIRPYMKTNGRAYFRAPYGNWLAEHAARLNAYPELSRYVGPVYWTAGGDLILNKSGGVSKAADWACWSEKYNVTPVDCATAYYREVTARGGGITLMHDHDIRTVELATNLISWLKDEGYGFVTLDQLKSFDEFK